VTKKHLPSGKKYHHHKECARVVMNWIGSEERRDLPGNDINNYGLKKSTMKDIALQEAVSC
jgi:hypothetical protein